MPLVKIDLGGVLKKIPAKVWMVVAIATLVLAIGIAFSLIRFGGVTVGVEELPAGEYQQEPDWNPKGGK